MPLSTNNKRQRAKGKKKKTACEGKTGTHKERLQNQLVLLGVSSAFSLSPALHLLPPMQRGPPADHTSSQKSEGRGRRFISPLSPGSALPLPLSLTRAVLFLKVQASSAPLWRSFNHTVTHAHTVGLFFPLLFFQTLISAQTACPIITSCALIGTYLKCLSIRI